MSTEKSKTDAAALANLRLPGPDDPLSIREQDFLFERLDRAIVAGRILTAGEVENVQRMRATIRWYRSRLAEVWEAIASGQPLDLDDDLPRRESLNGIAYLQEKAES